MNKKRGNVETSPHDFEVATYLYLNTLPSFDDEVNMRHIIEINDSVKNNEASMLRTKTILLSLVDELGESATQRKVLILMIQGEYSILEISEMLKLRPKLVKTYITHFQERMRKLNETM